MPFYVSEVIRKDGKPGKRFEMRQKVTEAPLKRHPKTGESVRRVILPPHAPNLRYDRAIRNLSKREKDFKAPADSVHKSITPTST